MHKTERSSDAKTIRRWIRESKHCYVWVHGAHDGIYLQIQKKQANKLVDSLFGTGMCARIHRYDDFNQLFFDADHEAR